MNSWFMISFLLFLLCASIDCSNNWLDFDAIDIYPKYDTRNCFFPFNYNGVTYKNCTTDGSNGDRPWCALTRDYVGLFTKCYDFTKSTLSCVFPFTLNGKTYNQCDYLSKTAIYKQCKTAHPVIKYRYCWEEHIKITGKPLLRTKDCDSRYKALSATHTKCAGPDDRAIEIPITSDEKIAILDMHNTFRAGVPAAYMFKLYWDDELADMAQSHSNMCAFDHDQASNRFTFNYYWKNGQNMVMSTEIRTPLADLLNMMFSSEQPEFHYGVGCYHDGTCTHYTQLMLSNMTRVGCAQTHCIYDDRIERYLTCNYINSQYSNNYMIPYELGKNHGSACPTRRDENGLCDCGKLICKFDQNENIHPDKCVCMPSASGKRSLDENESNEQDPNDAELNSGQKPYVAIVGGNNLGDSTGDRDKRSLHENQSNEEDPNDAELNSGQKPYVAIVGGNNLGDSTGDRVKRDIKKIYIPTSPAKRDIKKIYIPASPAKRELRKLALTKPKPQGSSNNDAMVDAL